ncbi:MAG: UDP-N-acetylmuramoylalanyl-D-glutamyl-2,6-diaminopimelate--D-alanyl-D-alanine ligase [Rhodospirillaceae bacterium]
MTGPCPPLWTAEAVIAATGGRCDRDWRAFGVSIDSRTVVPGDLFVALRGPNFDGHGFVAAALAAGAAAALVSERPAGLSAGAPLLFCDDTFIALQNLGRAGRARTAATVIAVTGSVGKTGTKEALLRCLEAQAPTYATAGSLNNHWGVPLSLARLPADCHHGVLELGMNHAGEIGPLSRMVRPAVGLITTIAPAHLEFFASVAAIADAKAELFEGMDQGGTAILNRDNDQFGRLERAARLAGVGHILSFGAADGADARLIACRCEADASMVEAEIGGVRLAYSLSLPGRHLVMNSLGVLLAVRAAGADLEAAARTLAVLPPVKGRGVRRRVALESGAFTLIDESYNASPAAMEASFAVAGAVATGAGGRRLAVLGDMRELGTAADDLHGALAGPLVAAGFDQVFCCGPHMRALYVSLPERVRGAYAEHAGALATVVAAAVRGGDVVLVKGSAGSRMGGVVAALAALDESQAAAAAAAIS